MATYIKIPLGNSSRGKGILVSSTTSPGTGIHPAPGSTSTVDEVWLYAMNTDTTARKLTIEYGASTAGDIIELTVPAESGLVLVVPGLVLTGSNLDPINITAFCAQANVVAIHGYVNRISGQNMPEIGLG